MAAIPSLGLCIEWKLAIEKINLFLLILHPLLVSDSKDVFVSRAHGNDSSTCGFKTHPCRTISLAIAHASSGDHIYLDSTGTESVPYTCDPLTSQHLGIYITDSLTLEGFPYMAYIKCSYGRRLYFNGTKQSLTPTIVLRNIFFYSSTLQLDDFNTDIDNCTFKENTLNAVLFTTTRMLTKFIINSSSFLNNQGCLLLQVSGYSGPQQVVVKVNNTIFRGTEAYRDDQGVLLAYDDLAQNGSVWNVSFANVIFKNNFKSNTGLITLFLTKSETNEVFDGFQVIGTQTQVQWGSAYFSRTVKSNITMTNTTFQSNVGHAMMILTTELVLGISHSTFSGNTGRGGGGALYILSPQLAQISVRESVFTENRAKQGQGGAIFMGGAGEVNFTVEKTKFMKNNAGGLVRAIFASGNLVRFYFNQVIFSGASTFGIGPSLYLLATNLGFFNIDHCVFLETRNYPVLSSVAFIFPNGSFYMYNTTSAMSTLNIDSEDSSYSFVNITGCHFSIDHCLDHAVGIREYAAVILKVRNGTLLMESLTFSGIGSFMNMDLANSIMTIRRTSFHGTSAGAVNMKLHGENKIRFQNCMFENNTWKEQGGAVYLEMSADTLQIPCAREGTSAGHSVWKYNDHVLFTNTSFSGNVAARGGAIFVVNGHLNVEHCQFTNNFAAIQGAHIMAEGQSTKIDIINSTFLQENLEREIQTSEGPSTFRTISFFHSESAGPLTIADSSFDVLPLSSVEPLLMVSGGGLIKLANNSDILCSIGSSLSLQEFTSVIQTEYNSSKCNMSSNLLVLSCRLCGSGSYSIQRGRSAGMVVEDGFQCRLCPYGADCLVNIVAKPNFWGYKVKGNIPALNFTSCPLNYCRPPVGTRHQEYNGCYGNRTGYLCGQCKKRFSESLFSTECQVSTECKDTWFWPAAAAVVILFALYLILKPPLFSFFYRLLTGSNFKGLCAQLKTSGEEMVESDNGYLKVIFYFYQVSDLLLISTSSKILLKSYVVLPTIGFFNFKQIPFGVSSVCPFEGLTAVTKELFLSLGVFAVLTAVMVAYLTHRLVLGVLRREAPMLGRYVAAAMETMLFGYASLARTSFKLLNCIPIGSEQRLFIKGDIVCYEWWQYLLTAFIIVFIVPFIVVLAWGSVRLYRHIISVRQFLLAAFFPLPLLFYWICLSCSNDGGFIQEHEAEQCKNELAKVVYGPFKKPEGECLGTVYWESVLIGRRFVLIVLHSMINNPFFRLLFLDLVCILILFHHFAVKPFQCSKANKAETVSLFSLVFIAAFNLCKACFISAGVEPRGPVQSMFYGLEWLEAIMLCVVPGLFVVCVALVVVVLCFRVIFALLLFVFHAPSKFRSYFLAVSEEEIKPLLGSGKRTGN